ncbi:hypothetical protein GT360_13965 [Vibrio astriarenae]|uniref:Uncharacterized protein n=1 Tax=Vibrio astriarenae TaxID=1481923 RepID=A0A7Z2T502_9VIBR|nr:hypothetical protein [Vibrio astriarenae]QIA64528.1 hypothetical protein GT360_13965 [Vibrio astriarenae]
MAKGVTFAHFQRQLDILRKGNFRLTEESVFTIYSALKIVKNHQVSNNKKRLGVVIS